jgi:MFS family permease
VPSGLQGRVSAGNRFLAYGGLALGPALAGVVAQGAGIPTVFVCGGLLTALMLIPFARHLTAQTMQTQQAT